MIPKTFLPRVAIVIGTLICFNLYWLIFGGPILLLGIISLLLERRSVKSKLIWTFVPPIFIYPGFILLIFVSGQIGFANAQMRDIIVEENFRGRVVIVETACGETPAIKEERLQFVVPSSGIYYFNGELKSGVLDENYYYHTANGQLVEIPGYFRKDEIKKTDSLSEEHLIGAFGGNFGTYGDGNNFIQKYFETNKNYSDQESWQQTNLQDKMIRDFRLNCK